MRVVPRFCLRHFGGPFDGDFCSAWWLRCSAGVVVISQGGVAASAGLLQQLLAMRTNDSCS